MEVRQFNQSKFNSMVESLHRKVAAYERYKILVNKIKEGAADLQEAEAYLLEQTNFKNPLAAADAMAVKDEYIQASKLENDFLGLDLNDVGKNGNALVLKESVLERLREVCTQYYTKEQSSKIKRLKGVIETLNSLENEYKTAVVGSRIDGNWIFAQHYFNDTLRQQERTARRTK